MDNELGFAADLYQGTAGHYDRYRLPYPEAMIGDLIQRAGISGKGRLLDLACGTGQLAFPLRRWFSEVWAVDREPDMVHVVRAKAEALRAGNIRPVVADGETLDAEPGYFELAVIGNAFHRLDRDLVAARLFRWLRPGGCIALCWSYGPHQGGEEWQQALAATLDRWRAVLGVEDRVPANWDEPRRLRPDHQVLADAGFGRVVHQDFTVEHRWSLPELAGFTRSTSFLPPSVIGERGAAFDADLAANLSPFSNDGTFSETVSFAYDLARKPGVYDGVRRISVVLFEGFELLDVFGPVELFSMVPDRLAIEFIGPEAGPVASSQGVQVTATVRYDAAAAPDIMLIPGGQGTRRLVNDEAFLSWLRAWATPASLVTSVCTGSAVLAAAGLLDGYRATSNKAAFEWVREQSEKVGWIAQARWVEDRDRWTSSGVAAGMDMAAALLADLFGQDVAQRATTRAELDVHQDASWDPFAKIYGLAE